MAPELRAAVHVGTSNDQSRVVGSMIDQLEGSVLTAIALVMIVILGALGVRPALLVGFAIPTSFLLCFALMAAMEISISNIVMFGLILAVGMLVDGAIVVVEYADKRIQDGVGPMHAYVEAAKRMFWPVVSSTATTLCAFLPMLFWPGVPGQFMGMLPVTLIFVLSASLIVALIYLPVMGGVTGRMTRRFGWASDWLRARAHWAVRWALVPPSLYLIYLGVRSTLAPGHLFGGTPIGDGLTSLLPGIALFLVGAVLSSITIGAAKVERAPRPAEARRKRTPFGWFIKLIAGNPIMPIVTVAAIIVMVVSVFSYYGTHNKGVEFFVASEPEQAIVYVRARGNLSITQKDALVREAEKVVLANPAVQNAFSFAGDGGLKTNTGGAQPPKDTIGQIQLELIPWKDRPDKAELWFTIPGLDIPIHHTVKDPAFEGNHTIAELTTALEKIPGIKIEILSADRGPASAKPVHLRLKSDNWDDLLAATQTARSQFDASPGLTLIEDTRPLPGIDWQIDVDVEKAGRYGADVATVGGMVQLVTRGLLLDKMRVPSSDEEIEIRVRLPEQDRVLSTLDTLKLRTKDGLVPLSNFITRKPVPKLAEINRADQKRYFDIKAGVATGLSVLRNAKTGATKTIPTDQLENDPNLKADYLEQGFTIQPLTANERITTLTKWLESNPFPSDVTWQWTGDQDDQAESETFLQTAFAGALALMFIILLAQFNSVYNSVLVLLAVVLSTTGVLIGMLVMDQSFSIIMTGVGIVALAGIVVNNNIVLIDTYQEYAGYMPRIEAIIRTAEDRIRPVFLTTITTMAGLAPMMFGLSLDFFGGGYTINSPTSLWWTQLATAVVFGLGIATGLTLVFTPSMLALRVWATTYVGWLARVLKALSLGRASRAAQDLALRRAARRIKHPELVWPQDWTEGWTTANPAPDTPDAPAEENPEPPTAADVKSVLARAGKLATIAPPAQADAPEPATDNDKDDGDDEGDDEGKDAGNDTSHAAE
ncbi:efflux RND transporter permease subunit [Aquicoccus sp. G2-2]|uniref:efflux RND transporter permease subunit n=1 Tax=Aquicoccus sp. G2-2 TaxID=3092120 RepID=UPI00366E74EF